MLRFFEENGKMVIVVSTADTPRLWEYLLFILDDDLCQRNIK